MACPDQESLVQYLLAKRAPRVLDDGEKTMAEHLAACERCQAQAREWGGILESMNDILSASTVVDPKSCVDENDLSEYFDGVLGGVEQLRVERHLADCRACVQRLVDLYELVPRESAAEAIYGVVIRWLHDGLELVEDSLRNMRSVPLTPVQVLRDRGDGRRAVACSVQSETGEIGLTIYKTDDATFTCTVAMEYKEGSAGSAVVSLYRDGVLLESRTQGDGTNVQFSDLEPGGYRIDIDLGGELSAIEFDVLREQ